jgi:hypothetical protein
MSQWKPTPELRLIVGKEKHQTIEQKWVREGFKDGETYLIETQWRQLPEVSSAATEGVRDGG